MTKLKKQIKEDSERAASALFKFQLEENGFNFKEHQYDFISKVNTNAFAMDFYKEDENVKS